VFTTCNGDMKHMKITHTHTHARTHTHTHTQPRTHTHTHTHTHTRTHTHTHTHTCTHTHTRTHTHTHMHAHTHTHTHTHTHSHTHMFTHTDTPDTQHCPPTAAHCCTGHKVCMHWSGTPCSVPFHDRLFAHLHLCRSAPKRLQPHATPPPSQQHTATQGAGRGCAGGAAAHGK